MGSLFDIVGEYKKLYEIMTDETASADAINTTLECLDADLAEKAAGYVAVINRLDMEAKKADEMVKAWEKERDTRKNNLKRMKERITAAMTALNIKEIDAGDHKIKRQYNGGLLSIDITGEVPEEYCKEVKEIKADNEKIRAALDAGKELKFAKFGERSQRLVIK